MIAPTKAPASMLAPTGILSVNLSAIQSNWRLVASQLRKGSDCAAVVKADAYGVGALEVAAALHNAGCRHFYVVTLDEAIELRELIPGDSTIYVLGGARKGSESLFPTHQLTPVLYTLSALSQWLCYCESIQTALPCAIKIDTGMTRLGFTGREFDEFLKMAPQAGWLNPVLLMSHLACADDENHPLNELQWSNFQKAVARIRSIFPGVRASLANSSGSFLDEKYHFDMVRIGAALYGINPHPGRHNPLAPVLGLKLPIQQIRLVETAVSVGYGATGKAEAGTRLAVVAGGYADGVHRTLGLKPQGMIAGVKVSSVGRVSMDSCVFDITASPLTNPQYIEVINEELTLDALMASNNTLGYEILTSLGKRFRREYQVAGESIEF